MRVQIGTAPRRRSLLRFLKRNFSYLVQKSRPKVSDLFKPPFYKGLVEVSPKLARLSDGGSFRVRQVFSPRQKTANGYRTVTYVSAA